ncbi:MAG: DUF1266 domain-containing protein [Variovorax sp.]|nr:MAG: DUF1266 domain-containing protein [Variovorax sp.]
MDLILIGLLCAVVAPVLVFLGLFRLRYGWSMDRWTRAARFEPTEDMSADQLFGCLLSANLALLEHDNFNQLASALPARRVRAILKTHWDIGSAETCRRAIFGGLRELGRESAEEEEAFSAWAAGATVDSNAFASLRDVCRFLSIDVQVASPHRFLRRDFSMTAWDIQQVAYITRLGSAAGFVPRDLAEEALEVLQRSARAAYTSWKDFSLAMLVGMGMRSPIDTFDTGGWVEFARSHTALLECRDTLLRHAAPWDPADAHRTPSASTVRPGAIAKPVSAFDALR